MIQQALIVAHVIVSVLMIAIILIQQGKGAEAGASFGGGASQSVLGATGNVSLLARITTFLTAMFFCLSFALAYYANHAVENSGQIKINVPTEAQDVPQAQSAPSDIPSVDASVKDETVSDVPVVEANVEEANADAEKATADSEKPASDVPEAP